MYLVDCDSSFVEYDVSAVSMKRCMCVSSRG